MGLSQRIVDITPVMDTSIYASGDVLADTFAVTNIGRTKNFGGTIETLVLIDEDDQGAAMTVLFFGANVSLGTVNGAPSISDANARNFIGKVTVATTDWLDLGGVRVAYFNLLGMIYRPATDTQNIYAAILNGTGTPTYTASGLKLRIGVVD